MSHQVLAVDLVDELLLELSEIVRDELVALFAPVADGLRERKVLAT